MKNYKKKGQMQGAIGAIVMLITGVGVATLVLIFVGTFGGQTYNLVEPDLNAIGEHTITGDAFSIGGYTGNITTLDKTYIHDGTLKVMNNSALITNGNFTVDYTAGSLTLTAGGEKFFNGTTTDLTANYTWGDIAPRTSVKAAITSSFEALEQAGDYMPIIVLAVVIALVLGLVLSLGMGVNKGSGGSAL
jgi:hypothetical protein